MSDHVDRLSEGTPQRSYSDWALAVHPDTPDDVLEQLAHRGAVALLQRVAEHANASDSLLLNLSMHPCSDVRAGVAENSHIPLTILLKLAADECPDVRYVIAENHQTPHTVLQLLMEDDNPYVAHRARQTFMRLVVAPTNVDRIAGGTEVRARELA